MTAPVLVAVDAPLAVGDVALTYATSVPLAPGTAALVPLGARLTVGYVLGPAPPADRELRAVLAPLPDIPAVPADLLHLAEWLAQEYVCTVGEALAAMLPPGLGKHLRVRLAARAALPRRIRALAERPTELARLRRALGPRAAEQLSCLLREGAIQLAAVLPTPPSRSPRRPRRPLAVHPSLWPSGRGSRTVVVPGAEREGTYLAALAEALAAGRQGLAVFAAVAAAERFAGRAREVLGAAVGVLHAEVPDEERLARWLAVRRGDVDVVVGTRAAVFAPLASLGVLIVDDEGDVGHREERVPRYHVREVASRRTAGAVLILADQVPTAETYARVGGAGVELLRPRRGPARARVGTIDLRRKTPDGGADVLAPPLVSRLGRAVKAGGRAVLFVHRKGYAALLCADCGYAPTCPRCEVPLDYDARGPVLRCRYCGDRYPPPSVCPQCGGRAFTPRGAGTQRVLRVARGLGLGPVLRLDRDVARTPDEVRRIVRQFRDRGAILVATPLVLEVADLPPVEVVGVVLADGLLRYPDYRAPERGLRALWQVRGLARTWCLVQTYTPDHPALVALRRADLSLFYREELRIRKDFHYPPYGEVVRVEVVGAPAAARGAALGLAAAAPPGSDVLGPAPLPGGRGRWQVMFRTSGRVSRDALAAWVRRAPSGIRVALDVNP